MTADDAELRNTNRKTVETFIDTEKRDLYLDQWAEDGLKDLPFAVLEETRWEGFDAIRRNSAENAVRRGGGDATRFDLRIYECLDPNVFFITNRCSDDKTFNGAAYPQRYIHQLILREGKVTEYREFFSSLVLERALRFQAPPALPEWTPLTYEPEPQLSETTAQTARDNAKIVEKWLLADSDDPESRKELWAENAVLEFPFAPPNQQTTRWQGTEQLARRARWVAENFSDLTPTDVQLFPSTDPRLVWARCRLSTKATGFGRPYPQEYLIAFTLEEGRVTSAQVYNDPILFATVVPLAA